MITPPLNTPCFYSVILEKPAAEFLLGLVSESFAKSGDVDQVLVSSKDFTSDIAATVELKEATKEIASHLIDLDGEIDESEKFNPMFIPQTKSLYDLCTFDDGGDIIEVDGFHSPFISMMTEISVTDHPAVMAGKVCYKQFALPALHTSLEPHKGYALS